MNRWLRKRRFRTGLLMAWASLLCCGQLACGQTSVQEPTFVTTDEPAAPPERLGRRGEGDDWPTLLGSRQDGISNETGIRTDWNQDAPPIIWELEVGEGYAIGSTALGRYVHFDRVGDEARVRALNAETGESLWEFRYETDYVDMYGYDGGPRCSPVIDEGRVYVFGAEGMLHCLALADGALVWKRDTNEEYGVLQNFFGVGSTPVVLGDQLFVMIGGSPQADQDLGRGRLDEATGNGSAIVALDKRTGEERWRVSDELASYSSLKTAHILDRDWVLAFTRGGLLGVEAETGMTHHFFPWRAPMLESVNASMPIVVGDQVLISETYGPGAAMLRLTNEGWQTVWADPERSRVKKLQTHWNTPVHVDGYVYASSGRHTQNAELRCVRWEDGELQWSVPDLTRCSLTLIDGHLLCQGEYGELRLLKVDPTEYQEVGRLELTRATATGLRRPLLGYPCWAAPVVSHGLLYVRGVDRVVCLELIPAE
ncbi:MAG: PQQ-binding-like beta-propeller repeat protein [Pirellulaceae bacterium]